MNTKRRKSKVQVLWLLILSVKSETPIRIYRKNTYSKKEKNSFIKNGFHSPKWKIKRKIVQKFYTNTQKIRHLCSYSCINAVFWSRRRGSNPRPQRPERCALPAALRLDCLLIFSTNAFIISNAISNVNLFSRTIITIFQSRRVFSIFSKFSLRTLSPIYPPRISPHSPYYTSTFG